MEKVRWITKSEYYDVETGEEINKEELNNYITIKKEKNVKFRNNEGTITWTNECKRTKYKQGELW